MSVSILFEDGKPIRVFKGDKCLFNAYRYAHSHFCLNEIEPKLLSHQLPEWLEVKFYPFMTETEFQKLIK